MFAGPHKVFSNKNKEMSRYSNHAVYSADVNESQEQCNTGLEIREDRFNSIGRIRVSLYPSAIKDNILQEIGFKPGFDLEKV